MRFISITIVSVLLLFGCVLIKKAEIRKDIKVDDLTPSFSDSDSIEYYSNNVYKMNPENTNDMVVALIRMNTLAVPTSKPYTEFLIKMMASKNKAFIDESKIRIRLNNEELMLYDKSFPKGYLSSISENYITEAQSMLIKRNVCNPADVDSTWAVFSATGDYNEIDRMISRLHEFSEKCAKTNESVVIDCCYDCMRWSIKSQAEHSKDVYMHLYQMSDTSKELGMTAKWLLPDSVDLFWFRYWAYKDSISKE